jgi:hypothetical protein
MEKQLLEAQDLAPQSPTPEASAMPEVHANNKGKHAKLVAGRRAERVAAVTITGRMTLLDVERNTGVAAADIANHLGLPASVPLDAHLGRLRRIYGFSIEDVRDYIERRLQDE